MNPLLSIVIPSVRSSVLDREFLQQCQSTRYNNQVEVLVLHDNNWNSTGAKMNRLIAMARGRYVMGAADDDIISPRLLPLVLEKCNGIVDVITFNVHVFGEKNPPFICKVNPVLFSEGYEPEKFTVEDNKTVQLRPWTPLIPTRKALYEGLEYPNQSWREDIVMAETIFPRIKTYHYYDECLYFAMPAMHNPWRNRSEQLNINRRNPRYES